MVAKSPKYKVYAGNGKYLGSLKYPEDCAAVVSLNGEGSTIRLGHGKKFTLWTEGVDGVASASYDYLAKLVYVREAEIRQSGFRANPTTEGGEG